MCLSSGECSCSHHCSEEKEEDAVDSCVECWANSEDDTNGKNKKKKRKNKGSLCGSLHIVSIVRPVLSLLIHIWLNIFDEMEKLRFDALSAKYCSNALF